MPPGPARPARRHLARGVERELRRRLPQLPRGCFKYSRENLNKKRQNFYVGFEHPLTESFPGNPQYRFSHGGGGLLVSLTQLPASQAAQLLSIGFVVYRMEGEDPDTEAQLFTALIRSSLKKAIK